jgi:ubiquinone biosynthesis protein UbiJ
VVQSSQLALTTAPNQIDQVAQELYRVLGPVGGIVQSSQVTQTGGLDGTATFQLSIPSSNLAITMSRLSQLPNARVASRTDSTQDVTNQFNGVTTKLADARALRTALLKQLALAVTTQQIDSLKAQIHDADAEIASYQGQLAGLSHQVNYSQVSVTISASAVPVPPHAGSGGFTIGKALHTAAKVLTVAAGAALIGLAGLLPFALVVALIWWIVATMRRRRREHALDIA